MSHNHPLKIAVTVVAVLVGSPMAVAEPAKPVGIGEKVPTSDQLRDLRGGRRPLDGFTKNQAVVLVFLGAECPVSNLYLPGLIELEKQYRPKGVQFLAVYPNEPDDAGKVAGHAYDRDVPFLVLKDYGQKLADAVGVTRVPTVAVLDGELTLRYRGRVDDQYGVAARRPKPTRDDLAEALDEVLAGKPVTAPETEADGCLLARAEKRVARPNVTFAKDVAPILQKRCEACHREGQTAPFTLSSYDDAVKHAAMIQEVTGQRRMPPWHADARYGKFTNDRHLTQAEIDTLAAWVDGGKPRGDDKDLPKPRQWAKGWVHGEPDQVFTMPTSSRCRPTACCRTRTGSSKQSSRRTGGFVSPRPGPAPPRWCTTSSPTSCGKGRTTRSARTVTWPSWSAGLRATWAWSARRTRPCASRRGPGCGWRCTTRPTARRRRTARRSVFSSRRSRRSTSC